MGSTPRVPGVKANISFAPTPDRQMVSTATIVEHHAPLRPEESGSLEPCRNAFWRTASRSVERGRTGASVGSVRGDCPAHCAASVTRPKRSVGIARFLDIARGSRRELGAVIRVPAVLLSLYTRGSRGLLRRCPPGRDGPGCDTGE